MIVVTNGTGEFGRLVVERLLTRLPATEVAVTTTEPQVAADFAALGVEVRPEAGTGLDLLAGADRVLSNPSPGWVRSRTPPSNFERVQSWIAAAAAAKVRRLVHIGIINNDRTHLLWHNALEHKVRHSNLPYTVLRNNVHTEAFVPAARLAISSGEYVCSIGDRTVAPAALADLAEAAAVVLTSDSHENEILELSGFGLTALGIASVIATVADRQIPLREVDGANLVAELVAAGASNDDAVDLADLYEAAARGEFSPQGEHLDRLLGRHHMSNVEALRIALNMSTPQGTIGNTRSMEQG